MRDILYSKVEWYPRGFFCLDVRTPRCCISTLPVNIKAKMKRNVSENYLTFHSVAEVEFTINTRRYNSLQIACIYASVELNLHTVTQEHCQNS